MRLSAEATRPTPTPTPTPGLGRVLGPARRTLWGGVAAVALTLVALCVAAVLVAG